MADLIRLKNTGRRTEIIYVDGETISIVPGGTVLVPTDHSARRVRALRPIDSIPQGSREEQELRSRVAELEAQLAAQKAAAAEEPADDGEEEEEAVKTYPLHLGGGKFELSDGTVTKGGTKRSEAEALEAELHEE